MAMTKAEKAIIEGLQNKLSLVQAQHRVPYLVDEISAEQGVGWTCNEFTLDLRHGHFEGNWHKYDDHGSSSSGSQGRGGPWYNNKADALRAARNAIAVRYFNTLANLDRRADEEEEAKVS